MNGAGRRTGYRCVDEDHVWLATPELDQFSRVSRANLRLNTQGLQTIGDKDSGRIIAALRIPTTQNQHGSSGFARSIRTRRKWVAQEMQGS